MKSFRLIIRNFLQNRGYDIVRVPKFKKDRNFLYLKIGNSELCMPKDHPLPLLLYKHVYYATNLPRIVKIVHEKYPNLQMVDIGANIGDTVAFVKKECPDVRIDCVEGDGKYCEYLYKNVLNFGDVVIHNVYLGENIESSNLSIDNSNGTGRIILGGTKTMNLTTLDILSDKFSSLFQSKILKIDTDGYDMKIIRGGYNYIEKSKPIIFFEYDRYYLDQNNDDGFSTLNKLLTFGYSKALIYESFGKLFISIDLVKEFDLFKKLDIYIKNGRAGIPYFDIALFHNDDIDLFDRLVREEYSYFNPTDSVVENC